jgi:hypothetical protein
VKIKSKIFYWYAAFLLAFLGLTLLPAPDRATLTRYHLSPLGLRLLDITIIIPEAIIWFIAFYGYHKLHRYGQLIKQDKEGRQVNRLSRGLLFLSISLPITTIISSILTLIASRHAGFSASATIISNYINVIFPLIAFIWISWGARGLSNLAKTRPRLPVIHLVMILVIVLGVVFCSLIVLSHRHLRTTYHLSPELVMLTLGAPYMYIWFLGLQASAELLEYSRKLVGIVYRKAWNLFIAGLAAIIFVSILLQYLTTLSSWLTSLSLSSVLLLLYTLLILLSGAYIVLALGAKKLTAIEEA